ncbi:heterokaryon incompatibility protein-domain-containing protein [Cercophora newfieldiana]|uniref:Heterokaryon incompatibility protein-domain-containing protein n=1 Tax=Cercophora newfieldiana TaxID=92897 RepID=A0AA39XU51_9PEZI|nr:heterokaryon incompatibility protein-domain-containing protein [Cercophora newfieldiana]
MSRWHLTTCRAPNIEVRGRAPFCRACGTEPDLPQLIAAKRNDSPFPPCPPDELPGAFNFSWPTTAPNQRPDPTPTSFQPALPSSPVYPIRLGSDELRVIILSASDDPTYPLHVDLESHHDGRCPEYETVSYSWGGENGDSSSSHPLFVGPYWDVLLLTKNCFDMLGYLRPWRGARTVWVDSICINQDDVQERETQVAKMARIYSECRQVIVYLGEDIVAPTMPGQYPFRRRLEDSIGDPQIGFLNLLSRRYFSRVWIIQELILPRQVVIPVGDMEISVDKTSGGALSWYNWNASAAPWFIEIGRRYLPQGNICDILRLICYSTSTDPRDKVFGAHALINNTQQDQLALRPDYSLSCLHVFFGVFAHSLITLKRTELLCNAAGISARDGYPSWTPDWTSPGAWGANRENTFGLSGGERGTWATHGNLPEQQGTTEKDLTAHAKSFMHVSPGALRWRTSFDLRWDEDIASMLWTDEVPLDVFSKGVDGIQAQARKSRQWDHEVSIDSATGSLSLQLIYLLAFPTPLERVAEEAGQSTFCLTTRTQWGDAEMYLTTDDGLPLDHIIQPELDHLFLMDRGHTEALLYLVLRSCQNERNEWGYRLLGCCYHLYFHAHPGTWHRRSLERIWGSKWDPGLKDEVVIEKELLRPDKQPSGSFLFATKKPRCLFAI